MDARPTSVVPTPVQNKSPQIHRPQLKDTSFEIIPALLNLLTLKDKQTHAHVNRVYELTKEWLAYLKHQRHWVGDTSSEVIEIAALIHDVGKVGVLDEVLLKKESLTTIERDHLEQHPEIGYQMIRDFPGMASIAESVRHHHERWDGGGYPLGLRAQQIPFGARVIAIVDTFDAIISERPYKEARPAKDAMEEIKREAGRQFCPVLVTQFIQFMHARNT